MSLVALSSVFLLVGSMYSFRSNFNSYLNASIVMYLVVNFLSPIFSVAFNGKIDRLDEILTVNLLSILIYRYFVKGHKLPIFSYIILASLIIGLLSSVFSKRNIVVSLEELLLFLKGWTLGIILSTLKYEVILLKKLILRITKFISIIILIGSLFQQVIPGWAYEFNVASGLQVDSRWGMTALVSFYSHPGVLAQVSGLAAIVILTLHRSKKFDLLNFLAFTDVFICILTFRRRSIVALIVILLVLMLLKASINRLVLLSLFIPFASIFLVRAYNFLSNATSELTGAYLDLGMRQARTALYLVAPQVANDYFPLGSGLGTFGTYISSKHYSDIYVEYGLSSIWGLRAQDTFITDTFWPAVLAELGWIGFILFMASTLVVTRHQIKSYYQSLAPDTDFFLCSFLVSMYLLIDSVAAPTFLVAPVAPIFGIFAGLSYSIKNSILKT
jgi:hypothetical protein